MTIKYIFIHISLLILDGNIISKHYLYSSSMLAGARDTEENSHKPLDILQLWNVRLITHSIRNF